MPPRGRGQRGLFSKHLCRSVFPQGQPQGRAEAKGEPATSYLAAELGNTAHIVLTDFLQA